MNITTERLILRDFVPEDWPAMYGYLSRELTVRYEPYRPVDEPTARRWAEERSTDPSFVAVCLRESGELLGNLYLAGEAHGRFELGYVFDDRRWGKGYATEAARALLADAIKHRGAQRIVAMCDPKNERSWRLLERLGMTREAHLRRNHWFFTDENGQPLWHDTFIYSLMPEDEGWRTLARE